MGSSCLVRTGETTTHHVRWTVGRKILTGRSTCGTRCTFLNKKDSLYCLIRKPTFGPCVGMVQGLEWAKYIDIRWGQVISSPHRQGSYASSLHISLTTPPKGKHCRAQGDPVGVIGGDPRVSLCDHHSFTCALNWGICCNRRVSTVSRRAKSLAM